MTQVLLAGGGLANSLIAWRLRELRPDVRLTMIERGATVGGNHTWSFHASDLGESQRQWLQPLVAHRWPGQGVRFPAFERALATGYHSLTSDLLHDRISRLLGADLRLGVAVAELRPDGVRLASGETLGADLVIDGRGAPSLPGFDLRWQKFLGVEAELAADHGLDRPLLMDATVEQHDGYRFVYVLPLGPRRLLIEDTYYSDGAELPIDALRERITRYAAANHWAFRQVIREETGVLPIVLAGDIDSYWRQAGVALPRSGMRALLFHHTTGYSLPDAVRLADLVATADVLDSGAVALRVRELSLARWREQRFFRLLNRLMFEAARPAERYRTLQHFYRCGEPLINRFYAGRLGRLDALRLLSGRPPVPLARALACLWRSARDVPGRTDAALRRNA